MQIEAIRALPEKDQERAVEILKELVRKDSSNPPGREYEVAIYAADILSRAGFSVEMDEYEKGRCNVVATFGDAEETGLILMGHLDVVPAVGTWKHPKFEPEVEDGLMYGRGTCDMKGGVAGIMAAAAAFTASGVKPDKNLVLILDSDEENGNKGIDRLLSKGPLKAEAAVVGEPSEGKLLLGNKGYSSFYIRTTGISCHASQPENGENAIYKMAKAVSVLEKYAEEVWKQADPYLGHASASVGTIHGGSRINVVPDSCVCELEQRLLPGDDAGEILQELRCRLNGIAEVLPREHITMPTLLDPEHPFTRITAEVMSAVLGREPESGVFTGGTEAAYISQFGIPTLIVGPGSLAQAHCVDEYVSILQVRQCADIYYRLIQRICIS